MVHDASPTYEVYQGIHGFAFPTGQGWTCTSPNAPCTPPTFGIKRSINGPWSSMRGIFSTGSTGGAMDERRDPSDRRRPTSP